MASTENRHYSFQKSPDSQWKDSWQRVGLQPVSSTCTSWPRIPERRWPVSFTFTVNTASRHNAPSLFSPVLHFEQSAFITDTKSGRQEFCTSFRHVQEWRVFCGLNESDTHHFYGSTMAVYTQCCLFLLYATVSDSNKSYKHATAFASSTAQNQRHLCAGHGF